MTERTPLPHSALYRACDPAAFAPDSAADAAADVGIAQERASASIRLGVSMASKGYNVFALGPAGIGKRSLVEALIAQHGRSGPRSPDWCYLHNFREPHRPRALSLPPGGGAKLARDMRELVEELSAAVPAVFESEEYRTRTEQIGADIDERTQGEFEKIAQDASANGIALLHTPAGFSLAPVKDGEVMAPDAFAALAETEQRRLQEKIEELQQQLQKAIRQVQRLQKERRARLRELNREMTLAVVTSVMEDMRIGYRDLPAVIAYLDEVQLDVLEHIDEFRRSADPMSGQAPQPEPEPESLHRYAVNVVVGNDRDDGHVTVVTEDYPSYQNLLGRIEYVARFGTLVTDFTLIKAGALHRANGGYLLIDARKLLQQPFAWDGLKRALATAEIKTESLGQAYGLVSTVALEPQPIPLDVKVVLFGDREIYYLMLALDPEFGELFKVAADFDDDIARSPDNERALGRLVAALASKESLPPFERSALARVVEHAARMTGDATRLSADLERLGDAVRESAAFARDRAAARVERDDVERALRAGRDREGRVRERIARAIAEGELMIDTSGDKVAQINALTVSFLGREGFGHPARVTATTRVGSGQVIDIQREVELGGPIHTKGVLILASFLASRFSSTTPHSMSASLVFEQTYGPVEGDSASLAELCVLMSSLADVPIRQHLALTGSVNQHGVVQPIGGVNEKIEGFFEVCSARGLDGAHGVLIPASNAAHLMLDDEVVRAAGQGRFHVYTCATVDEAIEILTGVPAGVRDAAGAWPPDSVNGRIAARLAEFSEQRQAFGRSREGDGSGDAKPGPRSG